MPPSHAEDALQTYRTLIHTARRVRRSVNTVLKEHSLTGAQFAILNSIPTEGITLTQLASLSWADPGNVSGIVDRLEGAGWVVRTRSKDDRRVVLIRLSDSGRDIVTMLAPQHREAAATAFKALSADEMNTLRELLGRIEPRLGG